MEKMPCFGRTEGSHVKVSSGSSAPSTSSFPYSSSSSSSSQSPAASLKSSLSSSLTPHKPQEKFVNGRGPATPRSVTPPSAHDGRRSPSRSPLDKRPAPSSSPSSSQDRRPSASPSPSSLDRRPSASPSPSSMDRRSSAPPSPLERKHQNGTKSSRHKRVSGKRFLLPFLFCCFYLLRDYNVW